MEYELMMQEIACIALWAVTFMVIMPAMGLILGLDVAHFASDRADRFACYFATAVGMLLCWSIGYTACL